MALLVYFILYSTWQYLYRLYSMIIPICSSKYVN